MRITDINYNCACHDLFNCCDCGEDDSVNSCGCAYCFSCNACDYCREDDEENCEMIGRNF